MTGVFLRGKIALISLTLNIAPATTGFVRIFQEPADSGCVLQETLSRAPNDLGELNHQQSASSARHSTDDVLSTGQTLRPRYYWGITNA
jgi:hypothetical protein